MDSVKFAYPSLLNSISEETSSPEFISLKGAAAVSEISYRPLSGSGTNTLTWSILPPSTSVIMDSTLLLEMDIELTARAQPNDVDVEFGFTCLESFPIQKAIQNLSITVNGLLLSNQPYRFAGLYERMDADDIHRRRYHSMFPARLNDTTYTSEISYNDMIKNGSRFGPFALHEFDPNRFEPSRYAFGFYDDSTTVGTVKKRTFHVCEPINLGNVFRDAHAMGISNLNRIDITIQFGDMLKLSVCNPRVKDSTAESIFEPADFWVPPGSSTNYAAGACSAGNTGGFDAPAILTVARDNEVLRCRYMTASAEIPSVIKMPYTQIMPYQNNFRNTTLAPCVNNNTPSTQSFTLQSIKASQVPSYIYMVARPALLAEKDEFTADAFFQINKLNLIVQNNVGVLSGATPFQLFQISARNGYNLSWNQWKKQCVIILKVGEDVAGVPGAIGQFSLQATVDVAWYGDQEYGPFELQIDTFLSFDGVLEISRDSAQLRLGVNTSSIAQEITAEPVDMDHQNDVKHGGSVKSFFRGLGRALAPVGRSVLKIAEKVAVPALTTLATGGVGKLLGAGEGGQQMAGARMLAGAEHRRRMAGTKLLS